MAREKETIIVAAAASIAASGGPTHYPTSNTVHNIANYDDVEVIINVANSGSAPTSGAEVQIKVDRDGSGGTNLHKIGRTLIAGIAASTDYPWSIPIARGHTGLNFEVTHPATNAITLDIHIKGYKVKP